MIKSMTGFGRSEYSDGKRSITVEIKSVNHRYGDISVKMPRRYSFAEEKIKNTVKKTVSRGKVDVSVIVENLTEDDMTVKLNTMVAKQYVDNLGELQGTFGLSGEITLQFLATLPDVMKAVPDVEDEDEVCRAIQVPLKQAVENLDYMRTIEGEKLAEDLLKRGDFIRSLVKKIEERSPLVTEAYSEKLRERIKELIGNHVTVPEDRILLEAAIFADKCSITEELVQSGQPYDPAETDFGKERSACRQEAGLSGSGNEPRGQHDQVPRPMISKSPISCWRSKARLKKFAEQVQNIE